MKNHRIVIGIPFLASRHTKALELSLYSIRRFLPQDLDVFLQVDVSNRELAAEFSEDKIRDIMRQINIRYYTHDRSGGHKQDLVNWILDEAKADYAVIMHSDVFFCNDRILSVLLQPLYENPLNVFSCWKTPFVEYRSTFHMTESSASHFWVLPRIASWLFALNLDRCREHREIIGSAFNAHYWIRNGSRETLPAEPELFDRWFLKQDRTESIRSSEIDCLIDIGTFLRMYWDEGLITGHCLGEMGNPDFASLELTCHPAGFVHIEQYDPERFDDRFYAKELMQKRTEQIEQILQKMKGHCQE